MSSSGCRLLLLSLAALAPAASLELLPRDVFLPADAAAFIAEFSAAPPPRAPAPSNGTYVIDVSARAQTLWGIGFCCCAKNRHLRDVGPRYRGKRANP